MSRVLVWFGLMLVVIGVLTAALGALTGAFGGRGWRLPGDIVISRPGFTFVFPLATSILVSLVLTLILWLVTAALRR